VSVSIVTDSAAALPRELAVSSRIAVVPMRLVVNGEPVSDSETPIEVIVTASDVETSGPSPGDFVEVIERVMTPDGVLVFTLASTMSSTYESARLGAERCAGRVRVIDTQTAAGAEALVVLAAARSAAAGGSLEEVERVANSVMQRVHFVAMVPSLDFLAKSGRVPGIAEWVGRRMHVTPLFEFTSGGVRKHRPALSVAAAYDRMVQELRHDRVEGAALHVAAYHALAPDAAARVLALVERFVAPETAFIGEFGPVMVTHTGPGLVGLAWWWEPQ